MVSGPNENLEGVPATLPISTNVACGRERPLAPLWVPTCWVDVHTSTCAAYTFTATTKLCRRCPKPLQKENTAAT